jgi:hypothetical protein
MPNRYQYANNLNSKDTKKRYLGSVIYPRIKPTDNDLYIISEESDRLDLLSYKYYNDISLWWVIAIANNLNQASLHIEPGTQMRMPSNLSAILNEFEKINK